MKIKSQHVATENLRSSIRPRQTGLIRQLKLIREVGEICIKPESGNINEETLIAEEIKELANLFDKKKSIAIPKITQAIEKPKEKSVEVKEKAVIKKEPANDVTKLDDYSQILYERPDTYITYGEIQRKDNIKKFKEYEASTKEVEYLKKNDFNITTDQYEKAITALENDVDKGEMIPKERAIEVLKKELPSKSNEFYDKINEYWIARREILQKSLLRKYWKDQKYTDKYLQTTFRKREREKMKTRKNKSQHDECLRKLHEMKSNTQKYLFEIINNLYRKERIKKLMIMIKQIEFDIKISSSKTDKNKNEQKLKDLFKEYEANSKPPKVYQFVHEQSKNSYQNDNTKEINENNEKLELDKTPIQINKELSIIKQDKIQRKTNKPWKQTVSPVKLEKEFLKKETEKREKEEKERNKIFKYRIRINDIGMTVIDRYIQNDNSFCPFDDSFNYLILDECKDRNDPKANISKNKSFHEFDDCYYDYLKDMYKDIPTYSDEDEEEVNEECHDVKSFSNAYKQYLKHKRSILD